MVFRRAGTGACGVVGVVSAVAAGAVVHCLLTEPAALTQALEQRNPWPVVVHLAGLVVELFWMFVGRA